MYYYYYYYFREMENKKHQLDVDHFIFIFPSCCSLIHGSVTIISISSSADIGTQQKINEFCWGIWEMIKKMRGHLAIIISVFLPLKIGFLRVWPFGRSSSNHCFIFRRGCWQRRDLYRICKNPHYRYQSVRSNTKFIQIYIILMPNRLHYSALY